jgi:hypothetical protein
VSVSDVLLLVLSIAVLVYLGVAMFKPEWF